MIRTGTLHIVAGNLHVGKTEARNGNGGILAIRVRNVLEGTADNLYRCRLIDRINAVVPQFEMDVTISRHRILKRAIPEYNRLDILVRQLNRIPLRIDEALWPLAKIRFRTVADPLK